MAAPRNADDWQAVETRDDFVTLVGFLAFDWGRAESERQDREREGLWAGDWVGWAHGTPGDWLEAMHAWLTARRPPDLATEFEALLQEPTWKTFAFILSASRSYE